MQQALEQLTLDPQIRVEAVSNWYRTRAIGYEAQHAVVLNQPDFINGCALVVTPWEPMTLLHHLLQIEQQFGRVRREQWSPRTLDLDVLLYEDQIIHTPELWIPHPRMCQRAFVLLPLAEIAPHWEHPEKRLPIGELARVADDLALCRPVCLNSYANLTA